MEFDDAFSEEPCQIEYRFIGAGNESQSYTVCLRAGEWVRPERDRPWPPWTRLDFHQCPNCPLPAAPEARCPAAQSLVELIEQAGSWLSHDEIQLEVSTPERCVQGRTTAQRAVSSLCGLLMAASGCPHTRFFGPMARFHLPLSSEHETIYRATSMYLLAQFFRARNGAEADWDLTGLRRIYEHLHRVNGAMAQRLREACEQDAAINAIILLDMFTKTLPFCIEDSLADIEYLFKAYLPVVAPA